MTGVAYQPQTLVEIRWPWLSVIASYIILATIFLVSTIIWTHSSGLQIVKASSLAAMLGLDINVQNAMREGGLDDLKDLEETANKTIITLETDNNNQLGPKMRLLMA